MVGCLVWLMSTKFSQWINSCGKHSRVSDQSPGTTRHAQCSMYIHHSIIHSFILSALIACNIHIELLLLLSSYSWSILVQWIIDVIRMAAARVCARFTRVQNFGHHKREEREWIKSHCGIKLFTHNESINNK